jgi:hypothetical protein
VFIGEIKADGQFNVVWKTPGPVSEWATMHRLRLFRLFHVLICLGLWSGAVQALTASEASAIAVGETDARLEALAKAVATADDRTAAFIQALADDAVKVSGGRVFIVRDGKGVDPLTGLGIAVPADAEDVVSNNRMRGELDNAMAALKLFSKDDKLRLQGVKALLKEPDEARLPLVEKALAAEKNETIRTGLGRTPGHAVRRHQPGQHPAAGGAGPGHHLRPDGRHQHGARRADDDRRLRHLRRAEPVQGLAARGLRLVHRAGRYPPPS